VTDPNPDTAEDSALELLAALGRGPGTAPRTGRGAVTCAAPPRGRDRPPPGPQVTTRLQAAHPGAAQGRPVLLHGEEGGTWPVLRLAGRLGLATRIGLEDTLFLPDGQRALSNAELVAEGLTQYERARRAP
jgi:hypothetical protein